MSTLPLRRVVLLILFSASLTVTLGFVLPLLLNNFAKLLGLPEASVAECIVGVYLLLVVYVVMPPVPGSLKLLQAEGKAVFITGCDTGFGFALAKYLHKLGFTVFAGCFLKEKGGDGAKELEEMQSDRMKVVQLDVCSEDQVAQAAEFIRSNLEDPGRGLWAVVNNAGVSTFGDVEFTSMETYKQISEVNLWGTVRVTKALLPLIRKAKGRVVNMASMFGRFGNVMRSSYCISKYGVEAFSDCLRYEMKPWQVKVIVVEPGNFVAATGIMNRDSVAATSNKLWSEAPPGVQEDYGKANFEQRMAAFRSYCTCGPKDITPVIHAIADAVQSSRPFTRYYPMEVHWWIRMQVMTHLPAAISDWLYF